MIATAYAGRASHWLPQDPAVSTITACGLDIDKNDISWSRLRLPYGRQHGCPICRDKAMVKLADGSVSGVSGRSADMDPTR